jgi:hypothetical protein
MLSAGPSFREFYAQRRVSGSELAFYSCEGPVRLLDPYSYHRLQAWSCWQQGAVSSFFWSFGDSGGGSSWNEYSLSRPPSFTPLFLDDTSVTTSKHMEAIRESVEDYEYLSRLRAAVNFAGKTKKNPELLMRAQKLLSESADRVLNAPGASDIAWDQPKDRSIADAVRLEILECLKELEAGK